ncbi:MAG: hypothetical protein GWO24_09030, partial [Akkermansiaceae bacterium]|nr:hypothetical protein [Akkermansiaceae bacterium]
ATDGSNLVFAWDSAGGKLYNLRSETDPAATAPGAWPIFEGKADLEATPPENTLTIPLPEDPFRLFVIEEFDAPPVVVFSEDFESGQGEWTTGSNGSPGTDWELGAPMNVGPGLAHSPVNCFGTNLDADYGTEAEIWLRSPVIDLTTAGEATLHYFSFTDIEEGFDLGQVVVVDASDNSELAIVDDSVDGVTDDWKEVTRSIPDEALGKAVRLEFRFTSDDLQSFAGWYVDDVTVTVP